MDYKGVTVSGNIFQTQQQIAEQARIRLEQGRAAYKKHKFLTVGDLIKRLKKFNPKLPVCVFDTEYMDAFALQPKVELREGFFDNCHGDYVLVGGDRGGED